MDDDIPREDSSQVSGGTAKDLVLLPITLIAERLSNRKKTTMVDRKEEIVRKNDVIFTDVHEATAKAVMRGGQFDHFVIAWEGKSICNNPGEYVVIEDGERKTKELELGDVYNSPTPSRALLGGYRYIGIPPLNSIYKYDFKWRGVDVHGTPQEERRKTLDYILLKRDVYFIEVKAAIAGKGKDWVPIDVGCLVTVSITNPYKALFLGQNWLTALTNLIVPQVGDFISVESYETLTTGRVQFEARMVHHLWNVPYSPKPVAAEGASEQNGEATEQDQENCANGPLCGLNERPFVKYMEETWGVLIEDFRIGQISISKDVPKDSLEAKALERFIQRMVQRGEIETEKGRARQVGIKANAESGRIKTVINAWKEAGDLGKLIRILEAMEKTPAAYQFAVHEIPQLKDLAGSLGANKDTISRGEIEELLGILRGLKNKKD